MVVCKSNESAFHSLGLLQAIFMVDGEEVAFVNMVCWYCASLGNELL